MGLEVTTATALSLFATTYAVTLAHIHFFGSKPFGNLITLPVLLFLLLLCFFFASIMPSSRVAMSSNSPTMVAQQPGSAVAMRGLIAYSQGSFGWAVRTALVAMLVALLRSGSQV